MIKYAVLLAAGYGKRLKELTFNLPKALIDVNGTPLMEFSLMQLYRKVEHIHITIGYKKQKILNYLTVNNDKIKFIDTSHHGNCWWVFNSSLKYLNEPVLILACDIITKLDLQFIYSNYVKLGRPSCMMVPVYGVEGIDGDYIREKDGMVVNLSRNSPSPIYGSGIQVINPYIINKHFEEQGEFNHLWNRLIKKNMLYVSNVYPYSWFSINTKEQLNNYLQTSVLN